jgi:hypothetical protein
MISPSLTVETMNALQCPKWLLIGLSSPFSMSAVTAILSTFMNHRLVVFSLQTQAIEAFFEVSAAS